MTKWFFLGKWMLTIVVVLGSFAVAGAVRSVLNRDARFHPLACMLLAMGYGVAAGLVLHFYAILAWRSRFALDALTAAGLLATLLIAYNRDPLDSVNKAKQAGLVAVAAYVLTAAFCFVWTR